MKISTTGPAWKALPLLLLILTIPAALLIRFDNMKSWQKMPDIFLADNQPILINLDGYYYMGLAQDLLDNTYGRVDEKRAVPDSPHRPAPPPLLSIILSLAAKTGLVSLNWLGTIVPVVLSVLVCIPLYFFSRKWGGPVMSLVAGGLTLLAPYYILRTKVGVLDTDCLNVTFALASAYCALCFGECSGRKKLISLWACFLLYALFLWWWDQAPSAVTFLAIGPLIFASLFLFHGSKRQALYFYTIIIVVSLCILFVLFGPDFPSILYARIHSLLAYISKQETGLYPNIGTTIGEQVKPSFTAFAKMSAGNLFLFACAVLGVVQLFAARKKEFTVLLPMFVIGMFGYFFAVRFTIFLIPVMALGLGFLLSEMSKLKNLKLASLAISFSLITYMTYENLKDKPVDFPIFNGKVIQGMAELKKLTPVDSIIWSWWNEGHPLVYWARRSTINDGMVHGGKRSCLNALPLAATNDRFAANFMQFFQTRGMDGIQHFTDSLPGGKDLNNKLLKQILAAGPDKAKQILAKQQIQVTEQQKNIEEWLAYLFPANVRPMYLFLDNHLMNSHLWTYWYGTWDTSKHAGDKTLLTFSFPYRQIDEEKLASPSGSMFDYKKGNATLSRYYQGIVPIYQTAMTSADEPTKFRTYPANNEIIKLTYNSRFIVPHVLQPITTDTGRYQLEINFPARHVLFQDYKKSRTVPNRLFWRNKDFDPAYFMPVKLQTPHYQIWKVTGDQFLLQDNTCPSTHDIQKNSAF